MGLLNRIEREMSIAEACLGGEYVQVVVHRAKGVTRLRGLIGSSPMIGPQALHFADCRSVHGCFMNREICVAFLDEADVVTSVRALKRWRFVADRRASQALEFEPETAELLGLRAGAKFIFAEKG